MTPLPCRAILFDLDGTLVDSAQDLWRALNFVLARHGVATLALEQVRHLVGHGARSLIARGFWGEEAQAPVGEERFEQAVGDFMDYYRQHLVDHTRPFPDVPETLARLTQQGYRLGVVTNKPESLTHPLLAGLGLAQWFAVVVGGDTLPQRKPEPEPLHYAFAVLNACVTDGVMVGDSETDVLAARAAGCPVITVPYGYHRGLGVSRLNPDREVAHFKDIPGLLTLPYIQESGSCTN